jgi:glycosyltransferase involved in cell wall biosynthesis
MKIAMVSEHASPLAVLGGADAGGQNVHVAALAHELCRRGHQVVVYTRRDDEDLPTRVLIGSGVVVEHLDAGPPRAVPKDELLPFVPVLARRLADRLAEHRPDVVHAHFWMSGLASVAAAPPLGVPVVQTFHALGSVKRREQGRSDTSPAERISRERDICRSAQRIIASCTDEREELVRLGVDSRQVDVVPSGVDLDLFCVEGPVAPRNERQRLLAVGRLVPRKGVDDVIRALRWLPDVELLIAGGPDADDLYGDAEVVRLWKLAAEEGVEERVQLLGRVDHGKLPALIRSADAVVCLPWYEPFGIVPLEAMACGVPVVGSAVGGLLDTIVDGQTGLLVPPRRPRRAAAAIGRLLADDARRARLGANGHRRSSRFTWERVAEMTEATYRRAISMCQGREALKEQVG